MRPSRRNWMMSARATGAANRTIVATKRILFMMCSSQDSAIHAGSNEKQKDLLSNLTGGEPPAKEGALGIMDHMGRVLGLK